MQIPTPSEQHHWLLQLVGQWTFENECAMGPDQPPIKSSGSQSTRALGSLWILGDMIGTGPDGSEHHSVITLGYDPEKKKFLGSFISSCMAHLWPYEGTLDSTNRILTLNSEGPSFSGNGTAKYQDIFEIIDPDHHTMSSQYFDSDGQWIRFMHGDFHRVPSKG